MKTNTHIIGTLFLLLSLACARFSFSQVVAGGSSHSLFLCSTGSPMACGDNGSYQLGDGTFTPISKPTPVQVSGLSGITKVAAGIAHSLFLKNDGTVWACGNNINGQLGDGTTTNKITPVQVNGLTGIIAMAGGFNFSLFVKNDGTVWACGDNSVGQLGLGAVSGNKLTPVQVVSLTGIAAVAACSFRSLFLKNDGTVWACGQNNVGQLGDGSTTFKTSPVQVTGLTGILAIAAGVGHSLFVKNDGSVWACGQNDVGQLGDGTNVNKLTAIQVNGLTGVISVAASEQGSSSYFVKNDGTVWVCGKNDTGQLGDGTTTDKFTPVQASSLSGITSVGAGGSHALFVKNDGTIWSCGYNYSGQLGLGSTVTKHTPVQVMGLCTVPITDVESLTDHNELTIFPNPMSDFAILQTDKIFTDATLTIYNLSGQQIKQIKNGSGQIMIIQRDDLPSGLYFIHLTQTDRTIRTSKLVITDN